MKLIIFTPSTMHIKTICWKGVENIFTLSDLNIYEKLIYSLAIVILSQLFLNLCTFLAFTYSYPLLTEKYFLFSYFLFRNGFFFKISFRRRCFYIWIRYNGRSFQYCCDVNCKELKIFWMHFSEENTVNFVFRIFNF